MLQVQPKSIEDFFLCCSSRAPGEPTQQRGARGLGLAPSYEKSRERSFPLTALKNHRMTVRLNLSPIEAVGEAGEESLAVVFLALIVAIEQVVIDPTSQASREAIKDRVTLREIVIV